ncbi:MAG: hypothetical protein LBJ73_04360 [Rickettsiales bacterium]|jgi:hypothetical protein|nr:hypothetical protein [Rickettsiales bacterium]
MKKKYLFFAVCCALAMPAAHAEYDDARFRAEVLEGLDIVAAKSTAYTVEDDAPGELGLDVYQKKNVVQNDDAGMYIPNDMYVRGGVGFNLPFASDRVGIYGTQVDMAGGWGTQIGLGWNLSSYVRTEIDFQVSEFGFSGHKNAIASARQLGGTLYFDFARRYVRGGDVTKRRTFVPFMGLGAGLGTYEFDGLQGANGMFVAPRGILGFNIMLTDLVGVDVAYQYQMFIGDGFGWDTRARGVQNLGDVMVSFRFNF